jgi:hypothetical protein
MTTAALFESVRQPFTVLLTVPMALIGVFLIFRYSGAAFTREAYIGVIMMAGIVVNNAILLVDHVNHLRRAEGMALEAATIRGTLERVRPILMTSTTTIVGLLPLVLFSASANENIWNALAYALIGGLASSTVLVLTVTPALYLCSSDAPRPAASPASNARPASSSQSSKFAMRSSASVVRSSRFPPPSPPPIFSSMTMPDPLTLQAAREQAIDVLCRRFADDTISMPELERRLEKARQRADPGGAAVAPERPAGRPAGPCRPGETERRSAAGGTVASRRPASRVDRPPRGRRRVCPAKGR